VEKMNKIKKIPVQVANNANKIKPVELDDLDLRIIDELRENCKQSWRELARKLKVSQVTIMNRINALEKDGFIQGYTARVDPVKIGFEFAAFQGIQIEGLEFHKAIGELVTIPDAESVYATTGEFDVIVFFRARNRHHFAKVLQGIYTLKGVKSSKTYFAYALKENNKVVPPSQWF